MSRYFYLLLLLIATACAHPQVVQLRDWSSSNRALAETGQIKWSDYYKGLYLRVSQLPEIDGKGFYLRASNLLIDSALAMESGKISAEKFHSFRREMLAAESEYAEKSRAQNAASLAQAAAMYSQFLQTQAMQVQAWQATRPINCTSQRLGNYVTTNCQ